MGWAVNRLQEYLPTSTKQINTHNTKEGNEQRIIQNVRVGGFGKSKEVHKCILVLKSLNELVPPCLSDYFIRHSTIHTYETRQKNDVHLPY